MSHMRAAFLLTAMVLFLVLPDLAVGKDTTALATRLMETLHAFRSRYGFPGATAAIALPDGSLVTAAAGLADVEAGRHPARAALRSWWLDSGLCFQPSSLRRLQGDRGVPDQQRRWSGR